IAGNSGFVQKPHVAMDASGNFVVTYEQTANGQIDIIARRYTSSGVFRGQTVVASDPSRNEHDADVAMDAAGNVAVSYTLDLNSTDKDIQVVRFNSTGNRLGLVNDSFLNGADDDQTHSSVAMSPTGQIDVAYQVGSHGGGKEIIALSRFSASGVNLGH